MLGDFIRETRLNRKLSQRELGRLAGISGAYVNKLESNKIDKPSFETLDNLARALKIPINKLRSSITPMEYDPVKQRTPFELVRELTNSLPELIPVYARIGDKKAIEYAFIPQPTPTYRGRDMKMFGVKSNIKYKDLVKPGDVLVLARELAPADGDLCIKDTEDGVEICKDGGLPIITIIRQMKKLE